MNIKKILKSVGMKMGIEFIEINLSPFFAKLVLRITPFMYGLPYHFLVMCRGYSEDLENFTELVWADDKDLEFYDSETYPQFQLWVL